MAASTTPLSTQVPVLPTTPKAPSTEPDERQQRVAVVAARGIPGPAIPGPAVPVPRCLAPLSHTSQATHTHQDDPNASDKLKNICTVATGLNKLRKLSFARSTDYSATFLGTNADQAIWKIKIRSLASPQPPTFPLSEGEALIAGITPDPQVIKCFGCLLCDEQGRCFLPSNNLPPEFYKIEYFPYKEGRDLLQYREEHPGTLYKDALNWIIRIGETVAQIHKAGIAWLDFKFENVLVVKGENGELEFFCFDFETAMLARKEIDLSNPKGSTAYWAPECWEAWLDLLPDSPILKLRETHKIRGGTPSNPSPKMTAESATRLDSFAFGVLLHELLTNGVSPFCSTQESKPYWGEFDSDSSPLLYAYGKCSLLLEKLIENPRLQEIPELQGIKDPGIQEVIRKLLERDPMKRMSVADAVKKLEEIQKELGEETLLPPCVNS